MTELLGLSATDIGRANAAGRWTRLGRPRLLHSFCGGKWVIAAPYAMVATKVVRAAIRRVRIGKGLSCAFLRR
jgi:hypothetical protein